MSYAPASRFPVPDVLVHPFGNHGTWPGAAPASGTWTASLTMFWPIFFWRPYAVSAAWWMNGATVGTDSIDLGVYQMTDLSTGRLDLIRSTGSVLSAGTVNQAQSATAWKVAEKALTSGSDTNAGSATSFATASVTLKAGRLYLMSISNSKASAPDDPTTISGGGASFTKITSIGYNSAATPTMKTSVWRYMGTVDVTTTLTIDFGANVETGINWSLVEKSGTDQSGSNGAGAIVQSATGTVDAGTSVSATLAAFGSANNATFSAVGNTKAAVTPEAGYTEIHDISYATPTNGLQVQWRVDNETTPSVSWAVNNAAGLIGLEIKADTSPFVIPAGWNYLGMAVGGATATVFLTQVSRHQGQSTGMLELTSTFPLPSSAIPVPVSTTRRVALAGVASRTII